LGAGAGDGALAIAEPLRCSTLAGVMNGTLMKSCWISLGTLAIGWNA